MFIITFPWPKKLESNRKDVSKVTHSVDSICSVGGRIIIRQLRRMVTMMMREKRGWTRTCIATLRTGEKGERNHMESSAEKRKMSFPLLITMKVCKEILLTKTAISTLQFI